MRLLAHLVVGLALEDSGGAGEIFPAPLVDGFLISPPTRVCITDPARSLCASSQAVSADMNAAAKRYIPCATSRRRSLSRWGNAFLPASVIRCCSRSMSLWAVSAILAAVLGLGSKFAHGGKRDKRERCMGMHPLAPICSKMGLSRKGHHTHWQCSCILLYGNYGCIWVHRAALFDTI